MSETVPAVAEPLPDRMADEWNPELLERLYSLLEDVELGADAFTRELEKLRLKFDNAVYTELIYLLSHLRFAPEVAREHWRRILEHRARMIERQRSDVDPRVALVSYFVDVNRKLKSPKIIEMQLFERTRTSAYRDELTGLYNFRLFREFLGQEVHRCERCRTPLSLVMIDIDNFKQYNEENGHDAGNEALASVARILSETVRKADIAARYGGEEFALVLPSTPKISAQGLAERVRRSVEAHAFPGQERLTGRSLTVSLGVATFPGDAGEASELTRRADRAMYMAKSDGKNRVHLYGCNRRSFGRVAAEFTGRFSVMPDVDLPLSTIDVSETGVRFRTDRPVSRKKLIELRFDVPAGRTIVASGRVVHSERLGDDLFEVAVHMTDLEESHRRRLLDCLTQLAAAETS